MEIGREKVGDRERKDGIWEEIKWDIGRDKVGDRERKGGSQVDKRWGKVR